MTMSKDPISSQWFSRQLAQGSKTDQISARAGYYSQSSWARACWSASPLNNPGGGDHDKVLRVES